MSEHMMVGAWSPLSELRWDRALMTSCKQATGQTLQHSSSFYQTWTHSVTDSPLHKLKCFVSAGKVIDSSLLQTWTRTWKRTKQQRPGQLQLPWKRTKRSRTRARLPPKRRAYRRGKERLDQRLPEAETICGQANTVSWSKLVPASFLYRYNNGTKCPD